MIIKIGINRMISNLKVYNNCRVLYRQCKDKSTNMSSIIFDYYVNLHTSHNDKSSRGGAKPQHAGAEGQKAQYAGAQLPIMGRDRIGLWGNGDNVLPSITSGLDRMKNSNLNKGMAFTVEERQALGIHGLFPPRVKTQEEQVAHCKICLDRLEDPLNKYMYLQDLLDRNDKLFYRLVRENIFDIMPLVYTPTVGLACQKYGLCYARPKGLYISKYDKGHVYEVLKNWPETDVRVIVVTDGERILGLGDLGAFGMGIPIGKLSLYTAIAGIKPHQCLPITIDVGTNTQSILDDPLYIGIPEKRLRGQEFDDLIEEFMIAVVQRWGQNTLIQFEDFGNSNAFRLLEKYRETFTTFNDDIQGTAAVAVAGLLGALRITKKKLSDNVILFQGAGEANLGIAGLCEMAMVAEGLSLEDARSKIYLVDSKGLIIKDRPDGGVTGHKERYARPGQVMTDLTEIVKFIKPTILIGASAQGGAFNKEILQEMARNNERPIIFALSNPTHKAECTAAEAYTETDGKCVFATGSPFPPFEYKGKTYYTGQGNNAYIFPGVGLAAVCGGIRTIGEDLFLISAEVLASLVTEEDLAKGSIYTPLKNITEASVKIAIRVLEYADRKGNTTIHPLPSDLEGYIRAQMFNTDYVSAIPMSYKIPN